MNKASLNYLKLVAIDKVKKQGYKLDDITSSGMGSQGNPTRFYAAMSK